MGGIIVYLYNPDAFGTIPRGKYKKRLRQSPNNINGRFRNIQDTPLTGDNSSYIKILIRLLLKNRHLRPEEPLPDIKTNIKLLPKEKNCFIWFGHSSYYIQLNGKKILVDPIFSSHAGPVSFIARAFKYKYQYKCKDINQIDYLLITHDHWDHLDYRTMRLLRNKTKKVICGLGVRVHLELWKYSKSKIIDMDWNEKIKLDNDITVYSVPARHFSGRSFRKDKTLWLSYIVETPDKRIFLGCDGGYDNVFAETGAKFCGFDFAILENGQYNECWPYIYSNPKEVLQEVKDLNAKCLIPIHSCKFAISNHPWYEPLEDITHLNKDNDIHIITPMIGEVVSLDDVKYSINYWWKEVLN